MTSFFQTFRTVLLRSARSIGNHSMRTTGITESPTVRPPQSHEFDGPGLLAVDTIALDFKSIKMAECKLALRQKLK